MHDELELHEFLPHVGTEFHLEHPEGARVTVRLSEAVALADHRPKGLPGSRQPFSLIFLGPLEPMPGQATFTVRHAAMLELSCFLVPIGPDAEGRMRYQAIFN